MNKVLLDTNAFSKLLTGDEKVFLTISKADVVYMSVFVLGELYYGFKGGNRESDNREILDRFLEKPTVEILNATQDTADLFAQIKHDSKLSGDPIPISDVWIASQAMETGSILLTFDLHFLKIKGLRTWPSLKT